MLRKISYLLFACVGTCTYAKGPPLMRDSQVRDAVVHESIANYPGRCPCPYNTMKNGRSCGARSAYSRPGGRAPLCYPRDVSNDMVRRCREAHQ
jgi:hypothetical protein